jgi:hypothetical protein
MVYNHEIAFQKGRQTVEMGHQEIVGVLRDLVVLCGAFGVDLQRTSRERSFKNQVLVKSENVQKCPNPL